MVQVDTSESKAEGSAGGVEAGEYHWVIDDVSVESFEGVQSLKIVSSVLAGNPDQVGHKHTEFFNLGGKSVDRLRRLLVATNLMTEEEWIALQVRLAPYELWTSSKPATGAEKLGVARLL